MEKNNSEFSSCNLKTQHNNKIQKQHDSEREQLFLLVPINKTVNQGDTQLK